MRGAIEVKLMTIASDFPSLIMSKTYCSTTQCANTLTRRKANAIRENAIIAAPRPTQTSDVKSGVSISLPKQTAKIPARSNECYISKTPNYRPVRLGIQTDALHLRI